MDQCPRCGESDKRYFVVNEARSLCRKCLTYQGNEGEAIFADDVVEPVLAYALTEAQVSCSQAIERASRKGDVLVYAICGAGKTELVIETIRSALDRKLTVGIAVARRQVVLQLHERLRVIFPELLVTAVCEGHTAEINGHLIVCTTHQLFRYPQFFDVLILDEPDAFPFSSDATLQGFARMACRGTSIYLTATPSQKLKDKVKGGNMSEVNLFVRPHGFPLSTPQVKCGMHYVQVIILQRWLAKRTKQALVFVPSLHLGNKLAILLRLPFVYAACDQLDETIRLFKRGELQFMLCTTVLERGVTFSGIDVCVMHADHRVFSHASLIQIAGRVGRSFSDPEGEVLFLCGQKTRNIEACLRDIQQANVSCVSRHLSMA